ncbi:MAG: hypothetical protein NVS9B12_03270 [Vulcanimicrobiaceae bacterium]
MLRAAEQECRNHNHYYVGAEHMLVALLDEHDPDILASLSSQSIDPSDVHGAVRRALGPGVERMWEGVLVTPRVRKIVSLAEMSAGEREIEPIDLFEAIRMEGGGLAAEILRRAATRRNTAPAAE